MKDASLSKAVQPEDDGDGVRAGLALCVVVLVELGPRRRALSRSASCSERRLTAPSSAPLLLVARPAALTKPGLA